ncbi:MAG: DUF5107 domain-containing protein [Phycisphaerae bacterium]
MSELKFETLEIPSASLGPQNPLPPLHALINESTESLTAHARRSKEERDRRVYKYPRGALPHRLLDGYDRIRKPYGYRMAVLENQTLKASFLLERGGRLWSLIHKPTGRELLFSNPIFQPANLGIRNAWIAGGVEWNCAVMGHSVYTCTPVWAARVEGDHGPVLRLYEYDRLRGVPYQIDAYLPDGSAFLLVRVRIINPHDFEIPMYWWSNIALKETKDLRIICPTDMVYVREHNDHKLHKAKINRDGGPDQSYAVNRASDGYFAIPEDRRSWLAGLEGDGAGLIHASTARLRGRKKFSWSQEPGGRRWQNFLCGPDSAYMEVQAGLARNQAEYVDMPADTQWCWLEAYGLMQADPKLVHDKNYTVAFTEVSRRLDAALSYAWMENELVATEAMANRAPAEIIQRGSPWGPLEVKRRQKAGQRPLAPGGLVFDEQGITEEAQPWAALLETGELPYRKPTEEPGSFMTHPEWMAMLETAVKAGRGNHWLSWYHLGVMHYHHEEWAQAKSCWEKSLAMEPSAWAHRCLGVLARDHRKHGDCADQYLKAVAMEPNLWQLASESCNALLEAERPQEVLDLVGRLPPAVSSRPRIQVFRAKAMLDMGDVDSVEKILGTIELTDVREGELSLTELWFYMHAKRISKAEGVPINHALYERIWHEFPPPAQIDFRLWKDPSHLRKLEAKTRKQDKTA